ncbi:GGDEF domain-containing protein [Escherichia coli]|nr:GGDEF domain-containing protein [Escherichia coli]MDC9067939.1 GGDEF domain-containing protein [Escherichia coli]
MCVMIIDLDNFKKINDTWGHHVGDMVIMAIIDIIKNNIHNDVILARLGGEEFGLILKNIEVNEASKFGGASL